jgi:phenylacetate-CoA ligase
MVLRTICWKTFVRSRGLSPYLAELDRHRDLSADEARQDIGRRLLEQLKYFAKRSDALPEWRQAAQIDRVEELWDIWPTLPSITKQNLQTRFEANALRDRLGIEGVISSTGGSTGEPTSYLHDRAMLAAAGAGRYYIRRQFGWRPGIATIGVWGSERDIGKQRTFRNRVSGWLRNDWLVDGYELNERTVENVLRHLTRHQTVAIYGFTSMLEYVSRVLLDQHRALPGRVCAAWTGGESLDEYQAEVFFKAFGTSLRNFYGGREFGPIAYEANNRCSLRVMRPFVYAEVVDKHNYPAAPGTTGRLLLTSTICRGTPFLRYEIGDLARSDASDQDTSGVRSITQLHGRTAGLLTLASGKTINNNFWNHLFKDIAEVQQFQVVLRQDRSLLLRLRGTPWESNREDGVRALVRKLIGDVPLRFSWVEQIPRTSQGKLLQTVRED